MNEWMNESCVKYLSCTLYLYMLLTIIFSFHCVLQQEAAAAAQNSSIENTSNLAANNQQPPPQQPPNNVSSQPGPGAQSLPQNNQQQSMRPISSPNSSSSGSRSMSPAVGKFISPPHSYIYELFTAKKKDEKCAYGSVVLSWNCMVWGRGCIKGCFSRLTPILPRLKDVFSPFRFHNNKRKKNWKWYESDKKV